MKIIGLTGPIGSGKTSVGRILESRGYRYFSLSEQLVAQWTVENPGKEITRKDKQDIGDRLRREHGVGYWAAQTADAIEETLKTEGDSDVVVDAIFNPGEIDELRKRFPSISIIGVNAGWETREERVVSRAKKSDPTTDVRKLREALRRDMGINQPLEGQQVGMCLEMANDTIDNNTNLERDLESKLDSTLIRLGLEGVNDFAARK
jgi:dephospho-CoA kinase